MNELQANRAILKAACMRAIFNNDGSISDVRRSVLVTVELPNPEGVVKHHASLYSSAEFDALPDLIETSTRMPIGTVIEVWDGRLLSTRKNNAADGYYRLETEEPITCPTCGELGYDDPAECSFCEDQKYVNTQTERLF